MRKLSFILLFVFLAGILSTCKRYPDGPFFSFRTRMQRITGVWDLESYVAGGIDSTNIIKNDSCYCYYHFYKDNMNSSTDTYKFTFESAYMNSCGGLSDWHWECRKTCAYLSGSVFLGTSHYYTGGFWKIQKLSNSQLWLTSAYNGINYEVKLKKIRE